MMQRKSFERTYKSADLIMHIDNIKVVYIMGKLFICCKGWKSSAEKLYVYIGRKKKELKYYDVKRTDITTDGISGFIFYCEISENEINKKFKICCKDLSVSKKIKTISVENENNVQYIPLTETDKSFYAIDYINVVYRYGKMFLESSGWYVSKNGKGSKIRIYIDDIEIYNAVKYEDNYKIKELYSDYLNFEKPEFKIFTHIENFNENSKIIITNGAENNSEVLLSVKFSEIQNTANINFGIYSEDYSNSRYNIDCWGLAIDIGANRKPNVTVPNIKVYYKNKEIPFEAISVKRPDITKLYWVEDSKIPKCGYKISFFGKKNKKYNVKLSAFDMEKTVYLKTANELSFEKREQKRKYNTKEEYLKNIDCSVIKDNIYIIFNKGIKTYKQILEDRFSSENIQSDYYDYFLRHKANKEELRKELHEKKIEFKRPLISIVIPIYNPNINLLNKCLGSVFENLYDNFEICLYGKADEQVFLDKIDRSIIDSGKLKYDFSENFGISENTNRAIQMSRGEYIAFMDQDDIITEDALYEIVKAINNDGSEFIYSDEDKIDECGNKLYDPAFKPDFSQFYLESCNYICHFTVLSKKLIEKVGGLDKVFDGAQDYDLYLKCSEQTDKITHIPKVLYHWRAIKGSTAENMSGKAYAVDAGIKALNAHFDRIGVKARAVSAANPGFYKTEYSSFDEPRVSIIIPNYEHCDDLKKCITSILDKSSYKNIEVIIVENNSKSEEIFSYYKELEKTYDNIKIIKNDGEFNFSKLINKGVENAAGEYYLLLNNDTEMTNENGIFEMVSICRRERVGVVGAKLNYFDNTVQHAGVIIGLMGVAEHVFKGFNSNEDGYMYRLGLTQNYSAVTGACMLVKKSVFELVHGFSEDFPVAFNDIDFCLKVIEKNYQVVYTPYSEWYHYESKSRGIDTDIDKADRFYNDIDYFKSKWSKIFQRTDPFYNLNLTLIKSDFSIKNVEEETREKQEKIYK